MYLVVQCLFVLFLTHVCFEFLDFIYSFSFSILYEAQILHVQRNLLISWSLNLFLGLNLNLHLDAALWFVIAYLNSSIYLLFSYL